VNHENEPRGDHAQKTHQCGKTRSRSKRHRLRVCHSASLDAAHRARSLPIALASLNRWRLRKHPRRRDLCRPAPPAELRRHRQNRCASRTSMGACHPADYSMVMGKPRQHQRRFAAERRRPRRWMVPSARTDKPAGSGTGERINP
jgi:hypothetical protein